MDYYILSGQLSDNLYYVAALPAFQYALGKSQRTDPGACKLFLKTLNCAATRVGNISGLVIWYGPGSPFSVNLYSFQFRRNINTEGNNHSFIDKYANRL